MNLKKYDKLREKINTKDFEGSNKGLDSWLFAISFLGNIGSIFFSYFLVYPGLFKSISINIVNGIWAQVIAFIATNILLVVFEVIKRYLTRKFSFDFVSSMKKFNMSVTGWLTATILMIGLSYFLSIIGSKNLASISTYKNTIVESKTSTSKDSLSILFENKKKTFLVDNESLRLISNDLRKKLSETDVKFRAIRSEYQLNIDKNVQIINDNQKEIDKIDQQLSQNILDLKTTSIQEKADNKNDDTGNIILFIIIAIFCESVIFLGIYFREWFEYNLLVINKAKFEKIYAKKDRYRSLVSFIYSEGKANVGDQVISGLELKEILTDKTNIQNSNKLVDEFFIDMERLQIFNTVGKRRHINATYHEAMNIIENFDDTLRIIENMK